jgi:pyridoxamine 5'-phosphate oxidase
VLASRAVLEESYKAMDRKFTGQEVPLPPNWGGFRLAPASVEFWQGRRSRLHDRLRYRRETSGDWVIERLAS